MWISSLWPHWPPHWPCHPVPTAKSPDFLRRERLHPPPAGALDTGRELLLATRPAVMLDRMNRQRRGTDVARADRRPRQIVEPAAVRRLNRDQVMDHPIRRSARRHPFSNETKQMVAEGVSWLRVQEGLRYELVLKEQHREFAERVDLFPGGFRIEADGSVAGMAHGGHRQVLLVARRAVLLADVPDERRARSGRGRLQCRERLLGRCDECRVIEIVRQCARWRGDFLGLRRTFGAGGNEGIDNRRPTALLGDQPRGLRYQSERADRFTARRIRIGAAGQQQFDPPGGRRGGPGR